MVVPQNSKVYICHKNLAKSLVSLEVASNRWPVIVIMRVIDSVSCLIFGQITLERCPFEQVIMRQSGSSAHIRLMYSLSLPLYCTVLHFLPDSCSSKVTRRGHSQIKFGPFLLNHEVSPLDKLYLLSIQYTS